MPDRPPSDRPPSIRDIARACGYGKSTVAAALSNSPEIPAATASLIRAEAQGLLIGRILRRHRPLELDWSRFVAVAYELGFVRPPVHVVMLDRFEATRQAILLALARGYRRPGYVHLVHSAGEEIEPARLGGYLAGCAALPAADRLAVHVGAFHDNQGAGFAEWLARVRPDVVVGLNSLVLWWLRRMRIRVPEDVGFVTLQRDERDEASTSGFLRLGAAASRRAVEMLVGQIHINARGIPSPLQTVLVEPVWHEGTTLVPKPSASPPGR